MKIRVHIERLLLDGVSPAEGRAIGASLERELGRLLGEGGLPAAWSGGEAAGSGEIPHLDAGSVRLPSAPRPRSVGVELARQVYRGSRA